MTSSELRQAFIDFFVAQGHRYVPSASLVPQEMSTTLFTIAGMEPFVPVFLGDEPAPSKRAVSVQRCLRVAGAKSDIENVGRTGRHGTFLEMLGNFGFSDYGKREAIRWAWQFFTERLGLDPARLYVTVHVGDDEAQAIWEQEIGLDAARITRFDEDNFWTMGPTGPCGPCSEIFYDTGAAFASGPEDTGPNLGNRYVEVWNLVFQQYNREADGTLRPLAALNIDTGAGLERVLAVMNGKASMYETDLFTDLVDAQPPVGDTSLDAAEQLVRRRIIADHARAATALIADGVYPSNVDRGYVLRFLIRRAIRNGRLLGYAGGFLADLVPAVVSSLQSGFPELAEAGERIRAALAREEEAFERTLSRGEQMLQSRLAELAASGSKELRGVDAFLLHDTFGFPIELTHEILDEHGYTLEPGGFEREMQAQKDRARSDAAAKRGVVATSSGARVTHASEFTGYEGLEGRGTVLAILSETGASLPQLQAGERGKIILDKSSFYAERGGQIGDHGTLSSDAAVFEVDDTQPMADEIVHHGQVASGIVSVGDELTTSVDRRWREEIRRHHTSAHLLQYALRQTLGDDVVQAGSWVGPERMRFDFRAPTGGLTPEQRRKVVAIINRIIRDDYEVVTEEMALEQARESGAISMAGEQYGQTVRVLRAGPSVEFCGGTHALRTGELGYFVMLSESSIGSGVRRIEAVVSAAAEEFSLRQQDALQNIALSLTVKPDEVVSRIERMQQDLRRSEREIEELRAKLASADAQSYLAAATTIGTLTYVPALCDGDAAAAKILAGALRSRVSGETVIAVAARSGDTVSFTVLATDAAVKRGMHAGNLLKIAIPHIQGKGGGGPAQAQGGGTNASGAAAALAAIAESLAI